jgi:hypothetical protein
MQKLQFKPGVNRDQSNYTNEGGWYACDKVRFRSGQPQKIGGWLIATAQALIGVCRQMFTWVTTYGDNYMAVGTNAKLYIDAGANLYDITPSQHTSTNLGAAAGPFTATTGSSILSVSYSTDLGYNPTVGNYVNFTGAQGLGGNILDNVLNQSFQILSVNTTTHVYTIDTGVIADSSNTLHGGATVIANYEIDVGPASNTYGYGWGAGAWPAFTSTSLTNPFTATAIGISTLTVTQAAHGLANGDYVYFRSIASNPCGINRLVLLKAFEVTVTSTSTYTISTVIGSTTYLTASTAASGGSVVVAKGAAPARGWGDGAITPVTIYQQDWFMDNFDNDLVANIRNGVPYYWARDNAFATRAVPLSSITGASDVPTKVMQLLVSQGDKHLLAIGATPYGGGAFDPLLIRWSNQNEPANFTPLPTNSAGYIRVSRGDAIIRGIPTRQEILIYTNATLNSLQFLGTTDVFGIQELSDNISIAGPRAVITVSGQAFWMGTDKFYVYSGRVDTLPCTLRNHVFENINFSQMAQVVAGTNEQWNEVWWNYPTANSTVNNAYVIYNHFDKIWYYGTINRTAWNDSPLREFPQSAGGADGDQHIYNQEIGVDDNLLPMSSYIQSSDFDIVDGEQFLLIKRIIPDVEFAGSNMGANPTPAVTLTMKPRNFPGSAYSNSPSQSVIETNVDIYTDQVFLRARARQMGFQIASSDLGVQWQLGSPRLDGRPDGKR